MVDAVQNALLLNINSGADLAWGVETETLGVDRLEGALASAGVEDQTLSEMIGVHRLFQGDCPNQAKILKTLADLLRHPQRAGLWKKVLPHLGKLSLHVSPEVLSAHLSRFSSLRHVSFAEVASAVSSGRMLVASGAPGGVGKPPSQSLPSVEDIFRVNANNLRFQQAYQAFCRQRRLESSELSTRELFLAFLKEGEEDSAPLFTAEGTIDAGNLAEAYRKAKTPPASGGTLIVDAPVRIVDPQAVLVQFQRIQLLKILIGLEE